MSLLRPFLRLGPSGLGALVFMGLHLFFALTWGSLFQSSTLEAPWFLGSRASIVVTQAAVGVLALGFAARARGWRERFAAAGLITAGVMTALVAVFFALGPENVMVGPVRLWPVALASAFLLLAPAILAGTLLGGYLHAYLPPRDRRESTAPGGRSK